MDLIASHFRETGEIELFGPVKREKGYEHTFILFKMADSVEKIRTFMQKGLEKRRRLSEIILTEAEQMRLRIIMHPEMSLDTRTYLMQLNDDCLIAILSNLSLIDLNSTAVACGRLYELSTYVFSKKYAADMISFHSESLDEIRRVLNIFGPLTSQLEINEKLVKEKLDVLVLKRCVGTLESVHLANIKVNERLAKRLQQLFTQLTAIKVTACDVALNFCELLAVAKIGAHWYW